ncbi:lytic transglycosylase domain-containing protein [Alcanivorax sp. 1008]|uniref:lytic transglycosylase domain-containing protein n=1 Tax=Alcanivorax sp. 1008 TaxID=2816853 RepID=UPI001D787BE8|nr:transglycosylase SLT domain-containing protein [Alcanivorax sp. 1008]MCC1496725.1 transglycosylase SLT domain-containing protein [Alcanivorax sp. 1008]
MIKRMVRAVTMATLMVLAASSYAGSCYRDAADASRVDELVLKAVIESLYEGASSRKMLIETAIERSAKHNVNPAVVLAVIHAESAFDVNALSSKGAQGLMQIMPATAKWLGLVSPFDPEANIDAGVRYLAYLQRKFDRLELVLAAYNAGEGTVRRNKGVPPYKETQEYVRKVNMLKNHYQGVVERSKASSNSARCRSASGIAAALASELKARGSTWEAVGAIFSENPDAQRRFRKRVYQNWKTELAGLGSQP